MTQFEGFSSSRFKTEMKNFARGNQFKIEINAPLDLAGVAGLFPGGAADVAQKISFKAKATSLPALTIDPIDLSFRGRKCKIPGDRPDLGQWSVDIYLTDGMPERKFFESWSDGIVGIDCADQAPDTDSDVFADGTLFQLDRNGNHKTEYTFEGIWPSSIGEVAFDWDTGDPLTFNVVFEINNLRTVGVRKDGGVGNARAGTTPSNAQ